MSAMHPRVLVSRRIFVLASGFAVISGGTLPLFNARAQVLVAPGYDRYALPVFDKTTNTELKQAVDFQLSNAALPGTMHLIVMADIVTITENLVFPGKNLTIIARVVTGSAQISTAGRKGLPSYTVPAGRTPDNSGMDGAKDTGNGERGGNVSIFAGRIDGVLGIDTTGGAGGDAQAGGDGLTGAPGSGATSKSAAGNGGNGTAGGLAGRPGNGESAGSILVFSESPISAFTLTAEVSEPGAPSHHGAPGGAGAAGLAGSGTDTFRYPCNTVV